MSDQQRPLDTIAAWLEQHGLEDYVDLFIEQQVRVSDLALLTEEDVRGLGLPLGPRKRLLAAIEGLRTANPRSATAPPTRSENASSRDAERRQLTVMFADLVGSTELSQRLDPEDLRDINRVYQDAATASIERYGGYVARYMGDGILAYFGYPQAHEDDPERAVLAGIELCDAVRNLDAGQDLAVRVGIATGPVVVGDLIGEGAAQESAVVGETPNLAARLQGIAAPNSVVLSEPTRRLVGGRFDLEELGDYTLKGIANPVQAYRALCARSEVSRFEAAHTQILGPLSGRQGELSLLLQRWEQACAGEGQVLLLRGEPGVGKSRLVQALSERIGKGDTNVHLFQCSPYYAATAFYPFIEHLERVARFSRDDDTTTKKEKLQRVIGGSNSGDDTVMTLMASLLSLPVDDYPPLTMTAQKQRQETIRGLLMQIEAAAEKEPNLMLFEDAQWVDPSSEELIAAMIDRIQHLPILSVITYRPEYTPPWTGYGHVTAHSLNRLGRSYAAELVQRVANGKSLPAAVMDEILSRTDGVPLFVEELTKSILEAGFLVEKGDEYLLDGPIPHLSIPETLHDSLVSRLDRLSPVKEVAQIASCIGREFRYELLAAVSPMEHDELRNALSQLIDSELIFGHGLAPHETYAFKHALIRDAAYTGLLRRKRQELHSRIAQVLLSGVGQEEQAELELLAYHFAEAGEFQSAASYWRMAGERSLERSEIREAKTHFEKGLQALSRLPDTDARAELEVEILLGLGVALQDLAGSGSVEVERVYRKAYERAEQIDHLSHRFSATWGLWRLHNSRAEFDVARERADELLKIALSAKDDSFTLHAHHSHWRTAQICGDLSGAIHHVEQGLAAFDPDTPGSRQYPFGGHDPVVCAHSTVVPVLWVLGLPEQAETRFEQALDRARKLEHPSTLANCLGSLLDYVLLARRPHSEISAFADELEELGSSHGITLCLLRAMIARGWLLVEQSVPERGAELLREGLAELERIGQAKETPLYRTLLARVEAALGRSDLGLATLQPAIDEYIGGGIGHWVESEIFRIKGELLAMSATEYRDEALGCFRHAIELARERGANSLEIRAAMSHVRLCRARSIEDSATELLEPVYHRFTEGLRTPDLMDARNLLGI